MCDFTTAPAPGFAHRRRDGCKAARGRIESSGPGGDSPSAVRRTFFLGVGAIMRQLASQAKPRIAFRIYCVLLALLFIAGFGAWQLVLAPWLVAVAVTAGIFLLLCPERALLP